MEWFVAIVFAIFVSGLIWVTVEAVTHANAQKASNKAVSGQAPTLHG